MSSNNKKINSRLVVGFLLVFLFGTFLFVGQQIGLRGQHSNIYITSTNDFKEDGIIEVQSDSIFGLTSSKSHKLFILNNEEFNQMKYEVQIQKIYWATIVLVSFFILCLFFISVY